MNIYEDLRVVQARIGAMQYLVLVLMAVLFADFWYMQVLRRRHYLDLAESNRSRLVSIEAPRGPLLDREGHVLVENRPSFNIVLTPEGIDDLDRTVARLGEVLRMGEAQIRERLARRGAPFHPVVVKTDASLEDVAAIEARRVELPVARVEPVPLRSYPLASTAAHALGRVGEVTDRQLHTPEFASFEPGVLVGQAGVESQYNRSLMGKNGFRRVFVNSRGVEKGEAERQPPVDGPSLTLTLDSALQKAMDEAFQGRAGSAIALDPESGDVLAMTSTPSYDPNEFTTGIDAVLWSQLSSDPGTPLINRVIQGQYPPGSTFKIVMAVAGLEEGVIIPTTSVYCPGYLAIYDKVRRCSRPAGHGMVNVHKALALSCNVFFYQLGVQLEIERIARYARRLGLGASTGIDLPHESGGLVPSPEWKLRVQNAPWFGGETVSVAIGQGQLTVTPLQMARLVSVIANGGRLVRPHLVKAVGAEIAPWPSPEDLGFKPETIAAVRAGMVAAVNDQGTGWRARLPSLVVAGKTGSAQVVTRERLARGGPGVAAIQPHGWFVCFAPQERPRIALAVLVEHGGSGGEAAAPVAREILARFFRVEGVVPGESGPTDTADQLVADGR